MGSDLKIENRMAQSLKSTGQGARSRGQGEAQSAKRMAQSGRGSGTGEETKIKKLGVRLEN